MANIQEQPSKSDNSYEARLAELRAEIDQVDEALLHLLQKRCEIVENVGALKHEEGLDGTIIRPGREADMVRNVAQKLESSMPPAAAAFIWRMIISGCINIEEKAHISTYAPPTNRECYWLAREHFGSFTPASQCLSTMEVVRNVIEKKSTIGVLPIKEEEKRQPWWSLLCATENRPHIFCQLPFIRLAPSQKVEVFCIANVAPEPSSEDKSLWVVRLPETLAQSDIKQRLLEKNFEILDYSRTISQSQTSIEYLISMDGFLPDTSENRQKFYHYFTEIYPDFNSEKSLTFLGSYATSLAL